MNEINKYQDLRTELAGESDEEYREFAMKGIFSERPFIGVRIPKIREIVRRVSKDKITEFIKVEPIAIEEVLARGMLICRLNYNEMLEQFDSQISYIDNWCTCDIFCSGVSKLIKKHREEFLDSKIDKLIESKAEFSVRAGLVLLKVGYVDSDYLNVIFDRVERLAGRKEYYVRMAIAWLLAECFIKFPAATTGYLAASSLPKWTFNKTISKVCDSYRVEPEEKEMLKKMRKTAVSEADNKETLAQGKR